MGKATVTIIYQGTDITKDISGELISFSYTDKSIGEADELSLVVKDETNKWKSAWNPVKGDTIQATITTDTGTLPCGTFTVDELLFNGSKDGGNTLSINALGAGVKEGLRTKSSFAHEGKTLQTIATKIAEKYNYTVQGIIHNYSISRVTQFHETDLGFLHRLAEELGYMFSIRGTVLVFTYLPELSARSTGADVDYTDLIGSYSIRDKVAGVYIRGQNRYHNPKDKTLYSTMLAAGTNPSADSLNTHSHVDNDEQGIYLVDGRLYKKNLDQVEINCSVQGNVLLCAGNNATLTGAQWGNYAGGYFIGESRHTLDTDGAYVTGVRFKKILQNAPTGNAKGTEVGYPPQASVNDEANDIIDQLQQLINAINSNKISANFMFQLSYVILDKDVKSMQNKGRDDVAGSVTEKYQIIQDEALTDAQQTITDATDLQQYLKTEVLNGGF